MERRVGGPPGFRTPAAADALHTAVIAVGAATAASGLGLIAAPRRGVVHLGRRTVRSITVPVPDHRHVHGRVRRVVGNGARLGVETFGWRQRRAALGAGGQDRCRDPRSRAAFARSDRQTGDSLSPRSTPRPWFLLRQSCSRDGFDLCVQPNHGVPSCWRAAESASAWQAGVVQALDEAGLYVRPRRRHLGWDLHPRHVDVGSSTERARPALEDAARAAFHLTPPASQLRPSPHEWSAFGGADGVRTACFPPRRRRRHDPRPQRHDRNVQRRRLRQQDLRCNSPRRDRSRPDDRRRVTADLPSSRLERRRPGPMPCGSRTPIARGRTPRLQELWLVWCIGNTPVWGNGPLDQYVHMIELSANSALFAEVDQIADINARRANGEQVMGSTEQIVLHVVKPDLPLPLDPDFVAGRISAEALVAMGYRDAWRYLEHSISSRRSARRHHHPDARAPAGMSDQPAAAGIDCRRRRQAQLFRRVHDHRGVRPPSICRRSREGRRSRRRHRQPGMGIPAVRRRLGNRDRGRCRSDRRARSHLPRRRPRPADRDVDDAAQGLPGRGGARGARGPSPSSA